MIYEIARELHQRQPLMFYWGLGYGVLFVLFVLFALFDHRLVNGYNTWIKPMKFALTLLPYFWALAWFWPYMAMKQGMHYLPSLFVFLMFIEMAAIVFQAARGVPSHFNTSSAFNGAIFSIMATAIALNTALLIWLSIVSFSELPNMLPAQAWGWRFGLILLILGSLVGGMMGSRMSHSVGSDLGKGIPFLGWNKDGGDLRILHFLGIHALQILPFIGFLSDKWIKPGLAAPVLWIIVLIYSALLVFLLILTLHGQSIFAFGSKT